MPSGSGGRAQAKIGLTGERMAKSDQPHASMLEKALRSLRVQRIEVRPGKAGPRSYAHRIEDLLLTDEQIVDPYEKNRLTRWGLRNSQKRRREIPNELPPGQAGRRRTGSRGSMVAAKEVIAIDCRAGTT
jgi:hypothetical protein